jgi:hypothetical protein
MLICSAYSFSGEGDKSIAEKKQLVEEKTRIKEEKKKYKQWTENADKSLKPVPEELMKKFGIMGVWKSSKPEQNLPDDCTIEFYITEDCIVTRERFKDPNNGNLVYQGSCYRSTGGFYKPAGVDGVDVDFLISYCRGIKMVKNNETMKCISLTITGVEGGRYEQEKDEQIEYKKTGDTIPDDVKQVMDAYFRSVGKE